jgi:hypothetical protein
MRNALLIAAAVLITAGTALLFLPAGFIVAGLVLGAFVLLTD